MTPLNRPLCLLPNPHLFFVHDNFLRLIQRYKTFAFETALLNHLRTNHSGNAGNSFIYRHYRHELIRNVEHGLVFM